MSELIQANDSLIAEVECLKADLEQDRQHRMTLLNEHNKLLRACSELQRDNEELRAKLTAIRVML